MANPIGTKVTTMDMQDSSIEQTIKAQFSRYINKSR